MRGTPSPVIFAENGEFERILMATGDGPREIGSLGFSFFGIAANGDAIVYDAKKNGARHVFDANLQFVRTDTATEFRQTPTSGFLSIDGGVVFSFAFQSRTRAGLPLHVVSRDGRIVNSFGREDPSLPPNLAPEAQFAAMFRKVERAGDSALWAYSPIEFLLERWTLEGQRSYSVVHAADGWYAAALAQLRSLPASRSPQRSLATSLVKASTDPNVVWLLYLIQMPHATDFDPSGPLPSRGFDLVVEAVETRTWTVLTTRRFPDTYAWALDNAADRIAVSIAQGDLFGTFRICRLSLTRVP
jgi:hypothetical protein